MALVKRFNAYHRILHVAMAVSFIGLVASGMPIKYAQAPWAAWLTKLLGGYAGSGPDPSHLRGHHLRLFRGAYRLCPVRHRYRQKVQVQPPRALNPWSPGSRTSRTSSSNFKWFLGLGPRPQLDQWTYWEKFDYWAVFWGVGMIGVSGLFLWFPVFFGQFLPGWAFNIATVIHSDEALLAAGFIFTIHYFNTHMRPEKFPMDPVIFTGNLTLEELKHERPLEYERLVAENKLGQYATEAQAPWITDAGIIFGFLTVLIGFVYWS